MTFTSVNPHDPQTSSASGRQPAAPERRRPWPGPSRRRSVWRDTPGAARAKALSTRPARSSSGPASHRAWWSARSASRCPRRAARSRAAWRSCATTRRPRSLPDGETTPGRRRRPAADGTACSGRCGGADHALELSGCHPVVEGRAEPRIRQRDDPEAVERGGGHRAGCSSTSCAFLPPDVFQVVLGGAADGRPLIDHPDVAAISFTGSSGSASRSADARPSAAAACRPRWAARTRPSSWPTPTSTAPPPPSRTPPWATPGRSARRPAG